MILFITKNVTLKRIFITLNLKNMEGTVTISLKEYQDLCKHKEACLKRTPIVHSAGFTGWHIYIPTNNNLIDFHVGNPK